jgi:hypothetical protein
MSRRYAGSSSGKLSNSKARYAISAWIAAIRELNRGKSRFGSATRLAECQAITDSKCVVLLFCVFGGFSFAIKLHNSRIRPALTFQCIVRFQMVVLLLTISGGAICSGRDIVYNVQNGVVWAWKIFDTERVGVTGFRPSVWQWFILSTAYCYYHSQNFVPTMLHLLGVNLPDRKLVRYVFYTDYNFHLLFFWPLCFD